MQLVQLLFPSCSAPSAPCTHSTTRCCRQLSERAMLHGVAFKMHEGTRILRPQVNRISADDSRSNEPTTCNPRGHASATQTMGDGEPNSCVNSVEQCVALVAHVRRMCGEREKERDCVCLCVWLGGVCCMRLHEVSENELRPTVLARRGR